MIRSQGIDLTGNPTLPKRFLSTRSAERWSALSRRANRAEVLILQQKIMRTSFGGNIHSLTFALCNQVDAFRAAHMDHMERATGLACQFEGDTNCGKFSLDRTRVEIVPPM